MAGPQKGFIFDTELEVLMVEVVPEHSFPPNFSIHAVLQRCWRICPSCGPTRASQRLCAQQSELIASHPPQMIAAASGIIHSLIWFENKSLLLNIYLIHFCIVLPCMIRMWGVTIVWDLSVAPFAHFDKPGDWRKCVLAHVGFHEVSFLDA